MQSSFPGILNEISLRREFKKLREVTYTATVCKFRGGHFVLFLVWFRVQHSSVQPLIISFVFLLQHMSTLTHDCRSGQFLVWFISECGTTPFSFSLFFLFSCATADIVIDVDGLDNILPSWSSSTLSTMIFSTNQRPTIEVT